MVASNGPTVAGFSADNFDLFKNVFNYDGIDNETILNKWFTEPFRWEAVLGKLKSGNLEFLPPGVSYEFIMPSVYFTNVNSFIPIAMEKIYGKFYLEDWVKFFSTEEFSNDLNWKYRLIKFTTPEVIKKTWGTPSRKITFYEKTIRGNSTFGGMAIQLPYDWGKSKEISRYTAQAIVFTQMIHQTQSLLDHHKVLLIESVLNTPDQFIDFMTSHPNRENTTFENYCEDWEFPSQAILNDKSKPYPIHELIDFVNKKMSRHNPSWNKNGKDKCLLVPEHLLSKLINEAKYHENSTAGHKGKEGLFNVHGDAFKNFYRVKDYWLFPVGFYKTDDNPLGTNLLSCNKVDFIYNYFDPDVETLYLHDFNSKTEKPISYGDCFEHIIKVNEITTLREFTTFVLAAKDGNTAKDTAVYELFSNHIKRTLEMYEKKLLTGVSGEDETSSALGFFKGNYDKPDGFKWIISAFKKLNFWPRIPLGLMRDTITTTDSIIACQRNAISLINGPISVEFVEDRVKKVYYVDATKAFGIRVKDPSAYYVFSHVHYNRAKSNFAISTKLESSNKTHRNDIEHGGGRIKPFFLDFNTFSQFKEHKMNDINGKFSEFLKYMINDKRITQRLPIPKALTEYSDKYRTSKKYMKRPYLYYKYNNSPHNVLFLLSRIFFTGYQKAVQIGGGVPYIQECNYGPMEHVLDSKNVCLQNKN